MGYAIIYFSLHNISDMHTARKTLAYWDLSVQEWFSALNPKKQQITYNTAYISRNRYAHSNMFGGKWQLHANLQGDWRTRGTGLLKIQKRACMITSWISSFYMKILLFMYICMYSMYECIRPKNTPPGIFFGLLHVTYFPRTFLFVPFVCILPFNLKISPNHFSLFLFFRFFSFTCSPFHTFPPKWHRWFPHPKEGGGGIFLNIYR